MIISISFNNTFITADITRINKCLLPSFSKDIRIVTHRYLGVKATAGVLMNVQDEIDSLVTYYSRMQPDFGDFAEFTMGFLRKLGLRCER